MPSPPATRCTWLSLAPNCLASFQPNLLELSARAECRFQLSQCSRTATSHGKHSHSFNSQPQQPSFNSLLLLREQCKHELQSQGIRAEQRDSAGHHPGTSGSNIHVLGRLRISNKFLNRTKNTLNTSKKTPPNPTLL